MTLFPPLRLITGLHPIYTIVSAGYYEMRIDLEDWDGNVHVAKYRIFKIGSPDEKYRLTIAGYDNDTSDAGQNSPIDTQHGISSESTLIQRHDIESVLIQN